MSDPLFHMIAGAPRPVAPFSHAVEADGWVFLTGQMPTHPEAPDAPLPDGIAAQTERVMENLKIVLAGLGLGLEHVVQVRAFLTEFERDYAEMNRVYASYFPDDRRPARTCVGVTAMAVGALVEIDLIARRPDARRPDARRPDARRPDARRPDASRLDASRPDPNRPDPRRLD